MKWKKDKVYKHMAWRLAESSSKKVAANIMTWADKLAIGAGWPDRGGNPQVRAAPRLRKLSLSTQQALSHKTSGYPRCQAPCQALGDGEGRNQQMKRCQSRWDRAKSWFADLLGLLKKLLILVSLEVSMVQAEPDMLRATQPVIQLQ